MYSNFKNPKPKSLLFASSFMAGVLLSLPAFAQNILNIDATKAPKPIVYDYFNMGTKTSPSGQTIEMNNHYITYDKKPVIPIMGEFHYTRYPAEYWEEEIVKIKASGVNIIASYIIWMHHEEKPNEFNWSNDRDLKRFVDLCAKHNMKVFIRIGPWSHAEVRYGGIPEWVVEQMPTRTNDPTYLKYVERFYGQIAEQVKGRYWKDGGPIIGVQLENEYNLIGPGKGAEHIKTLKNIALSFGMDTPLYTVTGWDGTVYPKGEVSPVFAGYPDLPWGSSTTKMPPNEVYNFRFNNRLAGNAGAQTPSRTTGTAIEDMPNTPFLGAEYAGGLPIMYRRRPLISGDDIGAMLPVQLGSGVNLYGYYMYHGGRNPKGYGRLEENALLGGHNDVPIINYDFQSPFGQYGLTNSVLNKIRPYHTFMNSFGDRLALTYSHHPEKEPESMKDLVTPRFSVRTNGDSGFLFMSNYIRLHEMAEQKNIQFKVNLPSGPLVFPHKPINVQNGRYFIWPFNFDLDGAKLAWASAQPLTRIAEADEVTYFFIAEDGISPEFAINPSKDLKIDCLQRNCAKKKLENGTIVFTPKPSMDKAISIINGKKKVSIIVLTEKDADNLSMVEIKGKNRLVLTESEIGVYPSHINLTNLGNNNFKIGVYPAIENLAKSNPSLKALKNDGVFQSFTTSVAAQNLNLEYKKIREEGTALPIKMGGNANRALQPIPEAFGRSAAWSIKIPDNALTNLKDAFLEIDYYGDVARLFSGAEMIDDEYFYGNKWRIGLKRFAKEIKSPIDLTILPLRKDAPIYIDDNIKAKLPTTEQVAIVNSIKLIPQYEINLKLD